MERRTSQTDTGLGHPPDDYKRSGPHVYVSNKDGELATRGPRKGQVRWDRYRRMSSLGDIVPEPLIAWKNRHIAYGMTQLDQQPLPADISDRTFWDDVVAQAEQASGANLAADRGTHIHEQCARASVHAIEHGDEQWEHLIEGADHLGIDRDATLNAVIGFRMLCRELGWTVLKVEAKIVNDRLSAAGTVDYIVRAEETGDVFCIDLKGSKRLRPSYSCQLYGYSTGQPYRTEDDTRLDMPWEMADYGYIVQFDREQLVETGHCAWTAHKVDFSQAEALLELVDKTMELCDPTSNAAFFEPVAIQPADEPAEIASEAPQRPVETSEPDLGAEAARRFGALSPDDQARVRELRQNQGVADDDYPAILRLIDDVDPFQTDAGPGDRDRFVVAPANPSLSRDPDEGDPADPDAVRDLNQAFNRLSSERQGEMRNVVVKAGNLSISQNPSVRRFNLGAALIQLAAFADPGDLSPLVTALEWHTGLSVQYANADESAEFLDAAHQLIEGHLALEVTDQGGYRIKEQA